MSTERRRRRRSRGLRRWVGRALRCGRRQPFKTGALALGMVLLLALAWFAWNGWQAARSLSEVKREGEIMRAALARGDAVSARDALDEYLIAADDAASTTGGMTWSFLGRLPVMGDDFQGVATAATVLSDVGYAGLVPVVDVANQVTADRFQPQDHRFPLHSISAVAGPAGRSEAAFDAAHRRLAAIDPTGFIGPIRSAFIDLRSLVGDARSALGSAYRASRLMPNLLGAAGPRDYLLVLQNNAESRSTGGLPGSLSLVRANRGRVRIVDQMDMAQLRTEPDISQPLSKDEERLFGRILGTVGVDATLTPDIPRASDLIRNRWEAIKGGRVDGVFFVDPVAVSYLLAAVGDVPLDGYPPVSSTNVVHSVENEVYLRSNDNQAHSRYQEAVARGVFDAFAAGTGDSAGVIRGLADGVREGRVRMHLFSRPEQDVIAGTQIAGEFVDRPADRPLVGVYVNDAGPTKMQYYLRQKAELFARRCERGRQALVTTISFTNDTPPRADLLPDGVTGEFFPGNRTDPGQQLLVVYVSAPVGGNVVSVEIDGQRTEATALTYGGREIAPIGLLLEPDESRSVEVVMRSAVGQTSDTVLEMSPGAQPGSSNATVPSACDIR